MTRSENALRKIGGRQNVFQCMKFIQCNISLIYIFQSFLYYGDILVAVNWSGNLKIQTFHEWLQANLVWTLMWYYTFESGEIRYEPATSLDSFDWLKWRVCCVLKVDLLLFEWRYDILAIVARIKRGSALHFMMTLPQTGSNIQDWKAILRWNLDYSIPIMNYFVSLIINLNIWI